MDRRSPQGGDWQVVTPGEAGFSPDLARIADLAFGVASRDPGREAAVFGARRLTYGALADAVEACAKAMLAHGVLRGDRVAMISTPRPEFLIVFLASLRIGAVWVGLNPAHRIGELDRVLRDARPTLLFGFAALRGRDCRPILAAIAAAHPAIAQVILFETEAGGPSICYDAFVAAAKACPDTAYRAAVEAVAADDLASIVYSSGSTGAPKGVMLTQGNLALCGAVQLAHIPDGALRALCNLPVSHTACTADVVAYCLTAGGTLVFQERFDAAAVLDAVAAERITYLMQIPAMLQKILALPDLGRYDTSSLKTILFLGAPMAAAQIQRLRGLCGCVMTGWGLSESTTSVTLTDPSDGIEVLTDTVGRVCPGYALRIVDAQGRAVDPGVVGEVLVRGACVMAGYYRDPAATAAAFDGEGWLRSGDLGRIDEQGRLRLAGRIKEMFKSGGYNVWPREVERVLETHPGVALCAVVPMRDPIYHEVGCAFVIPADGGVGADALSAHCRARLADYKVPKRFVIRRSLPMLAIGKIDRRALGAEAMRDAVAAAPPTAAQG